MAVGLAGVWFARMAIARQVLVGWLEQRGVSAQVEFEGLGLSGLTGRVRVGPANDPDLTVERVEVRYAPEGFWSGDPLGVKVAQVRLVRPVLKARLKGGRFSLGALDPVIAELRKRPPQPDRRQPDILAEDARVRLATDYGPLDARGTIRLAEGKLMRLDAQVAPTRFNTARADISLRSATVRAVTTGDRIGLAVEANLGRVEASGVKADDAIARLVGELPYPDLKRRRGDGVVRLRLTSSVRAVQRGELRAQGLTLTGGFDGRSTGWIDDLAVNGVLTAQARAASGGLPGATFARARIDARSTAAVWTRRGGDHFSLPLAAGLEADGALTGLGAPKRGDLAELAAVKRAARAFHVSAPRVTLDATSGLALAAPVTVRSASGGVLTALTAGKALRLTMAGGGLPSAEAVVDRFALKDGDLSVWGRLSARSSLDFIKDASFAVPGVLHVAKGGATTFTASACADLAIRHLEFGANDVESVAGRLCPGAAPLFAFAGGNWRLRGEARGLSAAVPFLEARISEAAGSLDFSGGAVLPAAAITIRHARIADTAAGTRFNPLSGAGHAALADGVWRGTFDLADPAGRRLGEAAILHDARTGVGGVAFDTGQIHFAPDALQPAALSPLAEAVGSPATGSARFTGRIDWTPFGQASGGTLVVPGLDFKSPAGLVSGLSGEVVFTSLVPLATAPGQHLRVERLEAFAPLSGASIDFELGGDRLKISGGSADVGGGKLTLEALDLPLSGGTWTGAIAFEGVQLMDMVEASPFGDRVDLTARVTGRVPFTVTADGPRIAGGELRAIEPGRLSIRREALGPVAGQGGVAEAPNTFTDFAYQAMENLAFDRLDARVDSLPGGRLGILFHIRGRHDPPQEQEIKLTLSEIVSKRYLTRTLPLPSGTEVDLTLDTSVNLDRLLEDFAEYQRLRRSGPVQPEGTKP